MGKLISAILNRLLNSEDTTQERALAVFGSSLKSLHMDIQSVNKILCSCLHVSKVLRERQL